MNVGDSGEGRGLDIDLNLAPIIDCFTVLITFMLASASFLAIGIFDTSVAAPSAEANPDAKPPSINLEVELNTAKEIIFRVNGKTKIDRKIASKADDYDHKALIAEINNLKAQFPDTKMLTLSATDEVEYLQLIRVMEALKTHIPTTLLGGF